MSDLHNRSLRPGYIASTSELRRLSCLVEDSHGIEELGVSECALARRRGVTTEAQRAYLAGRDGAANAKESTHRERERFVRRYADALRNHVRLGWLDASISHGAVGDSVRQEAARAFQERREAHAG